MIRLLHVLDSAPDFQTARAVEQLSKGLGAGFDVRTRTIGAGGDFRNPPSAAIALRREARTTDVVHAWGMSALAATAFAGFERIIFTPTSFPSRRQIAW